MVIGTLFKDARREILRTIFRYLSIVAIVALGVFFFVGVRAAGPDMRLTGETYFREIHFFDLHILCNYGLTDADVQALAEVEGIEAIAPGYSVDALVLREGNARVVRLLSLPKEGAEAEINQVQLVEGRMPENDRECLVEGRIAYMLGYGVGSQISFSPVREKEIADYIGHDTYTVAGVCRSPLFISQERGSSSVGSGSLDAYAYLPFEAFSMEVYSDIYVRSHLDGEGVLEDSYEDKLEPLKLELERLGKARAEIRFADVLEEADAKLNDAKAEVADGEKKLKDAEDKIADAKRALDKGERDYQQGKAELAKRMAEGEKQINEAKAELAAGKTELDAQQKTLDDGRTALEEGRQQLQPLIQQLQQGEEALLQLQGQIDALKAQLALLPQTDSAYTALEQQLIQLQDIYDTQAAGLGQGQAQLREAQQQLDEKQRQLDDGAAQLAAAWKKYDDGAARLKQEEKALWEGKAEGEAQLAAAKKKIDNGRAELNRAEKEFLVEKADADAEIADAKIKIADAEADIAELKESKWYVLSQGSNYGFATYQQDAQRIGAIGQVFPLIFFLVAALVCLTAMTRMVEENRVSIGTLKSLGYGPVAIAGKYLLYAVSACFLGCGIGMAVGFTLLPMVIFDAYSMLYTLPPVITPFWPDLALTSFLFAFASTGLTAALVTFGVLRAEPATLMRPKAPKPGQRIFLERFNFLWKRLPFSQKVTLRNLFRYKSRLLMTLLGIAGCTALVFTGFALRDSISAIPAMHFGEIRHYDGEISLLNRKRAENLEDIDKLLQDKPLSRYMYVSQEAVDVRVGNQLREAYILVAQPGADITDYIALRTRLGHHPLKPSEEGIILTEKLAMILSLEPGDTVQLIDDDAMIHEAKIVGVAENYLSHFIFMTPNFYQNKMGRVLNYNQVIFDLNPDISEQQKTAMAEDLLNQDAVVSVSFNSANRDTLGDTVARLALVVVVLILSAAALAFVVLFNLNSINIEERKRELATIKLLGFFDGEVASYVYRENTLLTVLGAGLGLLFGIGLHRFIIVTAEVDLVMFSRLLNPLSFLYSFGITIGFGLLVNLAMMPILKRIDMVESLKSVE